MNEELTKQDIKDQFSQLHEEIEDSLNQLFNKEVTIKHDAKADVSLSSLFESNPQQVCVYFETNTQRSNYRHLFFLSPEAVLNLYAWMIMGEPTDSVTEDHLEGLKEAADQVLGRVKMALADDPPQIDDLTVTQANSTADLEPYIEGKEGVTTSFTANFANEIFQIIYYSIPVKIRESKKANQEVDIQPAEFETITQAGKKNESSRNIDLLLDVELEVTVELGRKSVQISEVLKLGKGSILELEKSAGENLDILVNGRKLAEGEVVVIDEHFGIRITQLLSPKERVNLLK